MDSCRFVSIRADSWFPGISRALDKILPRLGRIPGLVVTIHLLTAALGTTQTAVENCGSATR
jgi:hypothetical protein